MGRKTSTVRKTPVGGYSNDGTTIRMSALDTQRVSRRQLARYRAAGSSKRNIGIVLVLVVGLSLWFSFDRPAAKNLADEIPGPRATYEANLKTRLPAVEPISIASIVHTVSTGETWGTICEQYGFGMAVGAKLDTALKKLAKEKDIPRNINRNQQLVFHFRDDGELQSVTTKRSSDKIITLARAEDDTFLGSLVELPKRTTERILLGEISRENSSFAQAANSAGVSYEVVDDLVDLFSNRISFRRDFRLGDKFTVIYNEKLLSDGTQVSHGPILAAALDVNGDRSVAIRYVGKDGKARYFDEAGKHIENAFLRYPVKFSRISSQFSKSRFHPVLKRRRPHNGVDFAAPTGTPVRSVARGRVVFAGRKGGAGKMIKIRHNERYSTAYLHLSKIEKGIRKGVEVSRGQQIGRVGATGLATGPHLHYSFYDRGRYVDPMRIKLPTFEELVPGAKISKPYLRKVVYTLDKYQQLDKRMFLVDAGYDL